MLTEKYKPQIIKELIQDETTLQEILNYIKNPYRQKPLMLYGKPGSGKTCCIYAIANDLNLKVIELNASDFKNKERVEKIVGNALQQKSLTGLGKIILIDETEGFFGNSDRGGISELVKLMEEAHYPIIFTANDAQNEKIKEIKKHCKLMLYEINDSAKIINLLKQIAEKEFGFCNEELLTNIARQCAGDVRSAINDLEVIGLTNKPVSMEIFARERHQKVKESIKRIFKSQTLESALPALNLVEEDMREILLQIEENVPLFYKKKDLAKAFDILSKADVFYGRIRRWQHWRFLVYINNLLTAGIAMSKSGSCLEGQYKDRNSRPLQYWIAQRKYQKRDEISKKISPLMHHSFRKTIKETWPFLHFIVNRDIAKELKLDEGEINFLKRG